MSAYAHPVTTSPSLLVSGENNTIHLVALTPLQGRSKAGGTCPPHPITWPAVLPSLLHSLLEQGTKARLWGQLDKNLIIFMLFTETHHIFL